MGRYFRPNTLLFPAMGVMFVCALVFSKARIGTGDLPGAEYYVFPFLHHGHGESARSFLPGSWSFNFLVPSYLLSVIGAAASGRVRPLAVTDSSVFLYIWLTVTAIVEVAADTLVPVFVHAYGHAFFPFVAGIHLALGGAVLAGHLCARGSAGDW